MSTSGLPAPRIAYPRWLQACARAGWPGRLPSEHVPAGSALGRVTAKPVIARWPSPPFACAAMDGIAIRARDGGQGNVPAGAFTWVDTGDPVPPGLDTVVQRELVTLRADGTAELTGPVPPGSHVRTVGEDFGAGELLVAAGHRLRPADLAAAAAAGHATLEVAAAPVVAIIPTGDEIRPVGSELRPGEVTESNSLMLAARATQAGARPAIAQVQPDDHDMLARAVRDAAEAADLVLVIAGSSAGRGDYTPAVLATVGELVVRGVAVRPGHPVLLGYARRRSAAAGAGGGLAGTVAGAGGAGLAGTAAGTGGGGLADTAAGAGGGGLAGTAVPVIGVPGYPLAAAVIFELFAAPLIAALQGAGTDEPVRQRARLTCDWVSAPDVEEWVPVALAAGGGGHGASSSGDSAGGAADGAGGAGDGAGGAASDRIMLATPTGRGAGAISRLVRADAWWTIDAGKAKFARGDIIEVRAAQ